MSSCPLRSCRVIPLDELPRDEVDNDDDDEGITATDEGDKEDDCAKFLPFCTVALCSCVCGGGITLPPLAFLI
jgi:hypothetical protein